MKQKLMSLTDKLLLRKRSLVETVNDQLKNISQIEHTRHRSPKNFLINLFAGLIAYNLQPKKPSLNLYGLEHSLWIAMGLGGGLFTAQLIGRDPKADKSTMVMNALIATVVITLGALGGAGILSVKSLGYGLLGSTIGGSTVVSWCCAKKTPAE